MLVAANFHSSVGITREFSGRFAVGAETEVQINIQNSGTYAISWQSKTNIRHR